VESTPVTPSGWFSVPEVAELLGLRQREVRAMLKDHRLLAVPYGENAATSVPAEFLLVGDDEGAPGVLASLPGTLTLLADSGYDAEASFRWLFTPHDELGSTPVQALRERRTHAVRRAAQTLAF
jgi:hypothetical protein